MLITYPRTDADYRALAASLTASVLQLIKDGKIQVSYKILFRHVVKERLASNPNYLRDINHQALSWFGAHGNQPGRNQIIAYHHSGAVVLHGFTVQSFHYVKKADRQQYKTERTTEFNKVRPAFLKQLANRHANELRAAGIAQAAIDRMASNGRPPDGYQVHHRIPLDDGGDNSFSNLILIRDDVEHRAIHGRFNPGELAADALRPGMGATIAHIRPPTDTVVYPNPAKGYLSEPASNHHFLEMLK